MQYQVISTDTIITVVTVKSTDTITEFAPIKHIIGQVAAKIAVGGGTHKNTRWAGKGINNILLSLQNLILIPHAAGNPT